MDASTCPTIDPGSDAAIGRAGLVSRDPRELPERPSAADIALAGIATHKVTRLIAKDRVTSFIRAPFTRYQEPAGHGELEEAARGTGLRPRDPQFEQVRTTLTRQPQPVPPIFQPEVAADAIVFAAAHPRRELWAGHSTVATIAGSMIAPWLADRYLARTNVGAQQTDHPLAPGPADYLYEPLPPAEVWIAVPRATGIPPLWRRPV